MVHNKVQKKSEYVFRNASLVYNKIRVWGSYLKEKARIFMGDLTRVNRNISVYIVLYSRI